MTAAIKVAIVEDDAVVRLDWAKAIQAEPAFKLAGLWENGESALHDLLSWEPHIILMDLLFPGLNGLECARKLKAKSADWKIILLSPCAPEVLLRFARDIHVQGFLLKPIDIRRIIAALPFVASGGLAFDDKNWDTGALAADPSDFASASLPVLIRGILEQSQKSSSTELLRDDLARASRYHVKEFARLLGLEPRTLERWIERYFGVSPHIWLACRREKETDRLTALNIPSHLIASQLGFKHERNFELWQVKHRYRAEG